MIAYLKGTIFQKRPHQVIIDINGVGYCAAIPLTTYFKLGDVGQPAELLIHTHLTDNALSLFGFMTEDERDLFLKLIGISGIGPKLAMNILSGIEAAELEDAIKKSDVGRISMIPGIGKKTALRITMELQDKIEKKEKLLAVKGSQEKEDLISALLNLGFRRKEVERVVDDTLRHHSEEAGFEKLLRECLKKMAKV
ncbi:MAG: Holliday junction branch migration protein RuvA [Candidatus Aminicenantes bacterium]|jgi:Holliday junction DNA helicase RuvA|nr:Holliday junction branch migration protein RuvA [Candidatus Aminicenantes bacterium]